jgi:rare lipoprotein A
MSNLRLHAVIPVLIIFTGVIVSARESPAAARERHWDATRAMRHHAPDKGSAAHRTAHSLTYQTVARRGSLQFAVHVRHPAHRVADLVGHREVAHESGHSFSGLASYYSEGQHVASGGTFDPSEYTCAHPTLPFGTHLRVADPKSGRSVVVTVNDRGPFVRGRVLDVSLGAARVLGMTGRGVMHVEAHVI